MDYAVFLNRLKQLLAHPNLLKAEKRDEHLKSFYGEIQLAAYCLMPNHFHLLLYQVSENAIPEFMRALSTSYTMYFNIKYSRVGSLFQGRYKARMIDKDEDWQRISRYIHLNPALIDAVDHYPYSSMQFYTNPESRPSWLLPERVLEQYRDYDHYRSFVMAYLAPEKRAALEERYTLN